MRRCLVPLIPLTDCDGRINVRLSNCGDCTAETTSLVLTKGGCPEYEDIVTEIECTNHGFGCGCQCSCPPQISVVTVEKPKPQLIYALHEINCDNEAVFVLDSKLSQAGYGRYNATVMRGDCAVLNFDIDYRCGVGNITAISTGTKSLGGEL